MQSNDPDLIEPGTQTEGAVPQDRQSRRSEDDLWRRVHDDPNDEEAFAGLVEIMRRRGVAQHGEGVVPHQADDATWALAEELAHSGRAWYPLIEMARLSLPHDRAGALSRLTTAVSRDHSGRALAAGVDMLCAAGAAAEAHALGVGHWRPLDHVVAAGRAVILAAVAAGRPLEVHSHWEALRNHSDHESLRALQADLGPLVRRTLDAGPRTGSLTLSTLPDEHVADLRAPAPSRSGPAQG